MASPETKSDRASSEWERLTGPRGFFCTVVEGPDYGRVFALDKAETVIGRGDDADLQLHDEKVSRRHLRLDLVADGQAGPRVVVRDLGSKNGMRVNGERVHDQALSSGDKIKLGDTILKFEEKDSLDLRYHEDLYRQATRDSLTGLANRTSFQAEARKFAALATRYDRVFSIVLVDVDGMEAINRVLGAEGGNRVLRAVGAVLAHEVRGFDLAAHLQADEFALLLPETPLAGALSLAERLRQAVAASDLAAAGLPQRVTISLGVAELPSSAADIEKLHQRAADALFQAKRGGRNRVCVAGLAASGAWEDDDTLL